MRRIKKGRGRKVERGGGRAGLVLISDCGMMGEGGIGGKKGGRRLGMGCGVGWLLFGVEVCVISSRICGVKRE